MTKHRFQKNKAKIAKNLEENIKKNPREKENIL